LGGRGAAAGFATRIPGADKAYIPDKKVVNFLLDPEKKHYKEFAAVGYSKEDPEKLKNDLLEGLKQNEAKIYERAAMKLLRVLDENCNYDPNELRLLENGSSAYHIPNGMHMPWIFGDYYLLEALMKLDGNDGRFTVHK